MRRYLSTVLKLALVGLGFGLFVVGVVEGISWVLKNYGAMAMFVALSTAVGAFVGVMVASLPRSETN